MQLSSSNHIIVPNLPLPTISLGKCPSNTKQQQMKAGLALQSVACKPISSSLPIIPHNFTLTFTKVLATPSLLICLTVQSGHGKNKCVIPFTVPGSMEMKDVLTKQEPLLLQFQTIGADRG